MNVKNIVVTLSLILVLLLITACGNNKKIKFESLTYKAEDYKISVNVPKGKNYKIIKGIVEEAKNSYKNAEYTIIGDKLRIEIDEATMTFTDSDFYSKKYGKNKEKNWSNYKQYILDDEITHLKQHGIELITVEGIESVQYKIYWDNIDGYDGLLRIMNTEGISNEYLLNIYIFPANENDKIEYLLKQDEIKTLLGSFKITKN